MSRSSLCSHLWTSWLQLSLSFARAFVALPKSMSPPAKAETIVIFKSIFVQTIEHLLRCIHCPGAGQAVLLTIMSMAGIVRMVVRDGNILKTNDFTHINNTGYCSSASG